MSQPGSHGGLFGRLIGHRSSTVDSNSFWLRRLLVLGPWSGAKIRPGAFINRDKQEGVGGHYSPPLTSTPNPPAPWPPPPSTRPPVTKWSTFSGLKYTPLPCYTRQVRKGASKAARIHTRRVGVVVHIPLLHLQQETLYLTYVQPPPCDSTSMERTLPTKSARFYSLSRQIHVVASLKHPDKPASFPQREYAKLHLSRQCRINPLPLLRD